MVRFMVRDAEGVRIVNIPRWAIALAVAGAALVAIPTAIAGGLVARWFARRRLKPRPERDPASVRPSGDPLVIDAEYRVIRDHRGADRS